MITAETIKDFPELSSAGLILRRSRKGPELDFLYRYLRESLPDAPVGQKLTIFVEPNIESVYPDAVAVYWDAGATSSWTDARRLITKADVQILHFLSLKRSANLDELTKFYSPTVVASLERLEAAELLIRKPRSWQVRPIREIFAVKRLVSIEAKIGDWQKGLFQAFFHTWFASESYLLLANRPRKSSLMKEASRLGIGVISQNHEGDEGSLKVRPNRIPRSYASWLFNEWAWKTTPR